jgi:hypothetical protein
MATQRGPKIVRNGLVLCLDAADRKSYPGSGTVWNDLSGNNKNGTLTNFGVQSFFSTTNGGNIIFDGTNDYIDVANTTTSFSFANTTFTVSIWFKPAVLSNGALISKDGATSGWGIWVVSDGTIVSYLKNGSSVDAYQKFTSSVLQINSWFNIVSVITTSTTITGNNSITNYVNGILNIGTTIATTTYNADNSFNLYLGRRTTSPYYNGSLAITQIYNRSLSASEVLQNFNSQRGRFGI